MSLLNPAFEKTDNAGQYMSDLRTTAYKHSVAVLAIHHVRKPGKDGVPALDQEDTVLMEWLNQASGHRSIINQSDTRIAAGLPKQPCQRSDDPTRKFLLKCESAGLVVQTGRGLYERLPLATSPTSKTIEQIEEVDETYYSPSSALAGA
jgi:hypothetical protein